MVAQRDHVVPWSSAREWTTVRDQVDDMIFKLKICRNCKILYRWLVNHFVLNGLILCQMIDSALLNVCFLYLVKVWTLTVGTQS